MLQLTVIVEKLNKRMAVPVTLADKDGVVGTVNKGFCFLGTEEAVVPNAALGKWYRDRDGYYYWGGGLAVDCTFDDLPLPLSATVSSLIADLPLNKLQCMECAGWLNTHFGSKFDLAVANTPFEKELLYAIACQEAAIYWRKWIHDFTPIEVLGRCVFDASGDANGTRMAFPRNTAAFLDRYGPMLTGVLISEANATRALRGWRPKQWVYAGYGIFQYDLQNILTDEEFFTLKKWYFIEDCLDRAMKELKSKWAVHPGDLFNTVKAYNGSGPAAERYAQHVFLFLAWIKNEL